MHQTLCDRASLEPVERYTASDSEITRSVLLRDGRVHRTTTRVEASDVNDARSAFDDAWLRGSTPPQITAMPLTVADLFSGCGGLSVGAHEAARAVGLHAVPVLGVDNDSDAMAVYSDNFPAADTHIGGIEELLDGDLGSLMTTRERGLSQRLQGLDLALGGPPCQGHSDLNNHTRRSDPRNRLYARMARFAEVVRPTNMIIENVPGVAHDADGVVQVTCGVLESLGYEVSHGLLRADRLGGGQARKRHFVIASLEAGRVTPVSDIEAMFAGPARSVLETIGDLITAPAVKNNVFDTAARHSATNTARIEHLFEHDLYELPNEYRPDCHRLKPHTYKSVYGRMYPDAPAPTITSGFGSTGQGRFVHPLLPRTLTPHEAARLQGFPDWFSFGAVVGRRALQKIIGNAVPSKLAYAAVASLLR